MRTLDLTARVITFPPGSAYKRVSIEPSRYVAARLIAELADAWVNYTEVIGLSPGSACGQSSAIRNLGEFLTRESDRSLSMRSTGRVIADRLYDWESALVERFSPPSTRPKDLGKVVRKFVGYHLQTEGITTGFLARWTVSPILDGTTPTTRPLDEFSNAERLALEKRCRAIVRATESRLALGRSLLARGRDPRKHGWKHLENVVWAIRWMPYKKSYRDRLAGEHPDITVPGIDEIVHAATGLHVDVRNVSTAAGLLLTPDDEYLTAIRILLHLQTGWAPEESKMLTRDDVEFCSNEVRVRATKNRAHRVRWFTLTSDRNSEPGWSAGDLLRRAAAAMATAYSMSSDENWFWTAGTGGWRGVRPTAYPFFGIHRCTFVAGGSLHSLIENHQLEISQPHDMRRLRKTVKSARAALIGTLSGAAGDDHTVEVFRGHYAQTTTVHTIAAQTVIRAQNKVLHRAANGPTLVEAAAATVATSSQDNAMAGIAQSVVDESPAERELSVAACSDPYSAPHSLAGDLCMDAPSMCLRCPNAVVFIDHLPRLVSYHEILLDQHKLMPPQVFHELCGQQLTNLEVILAQFPAYKVENARAAHVHIHRPLRERDHH